MSHRATATKRPRCRVPRPCLSGLRACDYSCLLDRPCLEAAHGSRRLLLRGLSAQFVRFCSRRPDGCRADGRPLPVRVTDSVISRLRPAASPLAAAAAAGRARNADVAARARLLAGASRSERLRCCRASSAVPGRSLPPAGRPRRSRVQVVPGIEANGAFFFCHVGGALLQGAGRWLVHPSRLLSAGPASSFPQCSLAQFGLSMPFTRLCKSTGCADIQAVAS